MLPGIVLKDSSGRFICKSECIGTGSSKVVFKAFDRATGREVDWCKIPSHMDYENHTKVQKEIQMMSALSHPYIVKLVAHWSDQRTGDLVLITDLYDAPLDHYIQKHGKQNMPVIRKWARQILIALQFLHHDNSTPITHRDLKCANIFVNNYTGDIAVGDLGFAKVMGDSCRNNSILGTAEYMAPEVLRGEYTHKADVYSFAMTMIEMTTLKKPYSKVRNVASLHMKVLNGVPPDELFFIKHKNLHSMLLRCMLPEANRPTVATLLESEFFSSTDGDLETIAELIEAPTNFGFFEAPIERYCLSGSDPS
jgi:WNK lysine deficient protein kinase